MSDIKSEQSEREGEAPTAKPSEGATQAPIIDQINKEIAKEKVVIFMKGTAQMPQCGFSYATCEVFNQLKVPFHTVDVLADPRVREGIKQLTNWPTIPQVFVNGKFIGGCDITRELFESGELKKMLGEVIPAQAGI